MVFDDDNRSPKLYGMLSNGVWVPLLSSSEIDDFETEDILEKMQQVLEEFANYKLEGDAKIRVKILGGTAIEFTNFLALRWN